MSHQDAPPPQSDATPTDAARTDTPVLSAERIEQVREKIVEAIRQVHDPEIPVNIYELGLIYDIDVQPSGDVNIRMTLTSPACPAAQELPVQVKTVTSRIAEVRDVDVKVVFDPPWKPAMMTEDARLLLGIY
jgi:FeS assembly SUF system protein